MNLDRAADVLGVSLNALERRLRRGDLPEAERQSNNDDPDAPEWTIPSSALAAIAEREGWVIDLRHDTDVTVTFEPELEFEAGVGTETQSDTEVEVDVEADAEPDTPVESGTEADTLVEADAEFGPDGEAELDADDEADAAEPSTEVTPTEVTPTEPLFSRPPERPAPVLPEPVVVEPGTGLDEMLERLLTMSSDLTDAVVARERAERTVEAQANELLRNEERIRASEAAVEFQESENVRLAADLNQALGDVRVAEALADERGIRIDELRDELANQQERSDEELRRHRAQNAELRRRLEASAHAMGWWSKRRMRDRPIH